MQWGPQHRSNIISQGKCPQASPWTQLPANLHNPWKLPSNTSLVWNGRAIHPSHSITYYRGVIYCNHCGYYTTGASVRKLQSLCLLKPPASQVRLLKRMKAGVFPLAHQDWPMPHEQQVPGHLLPPVVNGEFAEEAPYPLW